MFWKRYQGTPVEYVDRSSRCGFVLDTRVPGVPDGYRHNFEHSFEGQNDFCRYKVNITWRAKMIFLDTTLSQSGFCVQWHSK